MNLPVLILAYNRPSHLEKVLEAVVKLGCKVTVAVDGPKNEADVFAQEAIRSVASSYNVERVIERTSNKGLMGVPFFINNFFSVNEFGAVLEDDILVSKAFLDACEAYYCAYPSSKYVLCGSSYGKRDSEKSNFFYVSKYNSCWGWACNSQTWEAFDPIFQRYGDWRKLQRKKILSVPSEEEFKFWDHVYTTCMVRPWQSWALRWQFSLLVNKIPSIMPYFNLVENIGFDGSGNSAPNDCPGYYPREMDSVYSMPAVIDPSLRAEDDLDYQAFAQHYSKIFNRRKSGFQAKMRHFLRVG